MELTEIREQINRVDAELLRLFLERMELSEQVAAYKAAHGLPILNQEREHKILANVAEKSGEYARYAQRFFSTLLELSRRRQAELLPASAKILVLNGPNMNLLGVREPELYGGRTYADLLDMIRCEAENLGVAVDFFQSNHEGALVDAIQQAYFDKTDGIIFNPAAYTHTSVAILDALKATGIPTVEVHVTNPDTREDFRHVSYIRSAVIATIRGHGLEGYLEALRLLAEYVKIPSPMSEKGTD